MHFLVEFEINKLGKVRKILHNILLTIFFTRVVTQFMSTPLISVFLTIIVISGPRKDTRPKTIFLL